MPSVRPIRSWPREMMLCTSWRASCGVLGWMPFGAAVQASDPVSSSFVTPTPITAYWFSPPDAVPRYTR